MKPTGLLDKSFRLLRVERVRAGFGPISVSLLVGLELLVVAVVLWRMANTPVLIAILVMVGVVGLLLAAPTGGGPLGRWLMRRFGVLTGQRVVESETSSPGWGLFPGCRLRPIRDRSGNTVGVMEWAGTMTALITIAPGAGSLLRSRSLESLPLSTLLSRLARTGIPIDAVAVHSFVPAPVGVPAPGQPWPGRRDVVVAVRLRPLAAHAAVEQRGGGRAGADAALATLVAGVAAEVRVAGFAARVLDADEAQRLLDFAVTLGQPPDEAAPWAFTWNDVAGPSGTQRALLAAAWDPSAARALPTVGGGAVGVGESDPGASVIAGFESAPDDRAGLDVPTDVVRALGARLTPTDVALAVSVEAHVDPSSKSVDVRVVARVAAPDAHAAGAAANQVRDAATEFGLRLEPALGDQLAAVRAGAILGDGLGVVDPRDHPVLVPRLRVPFHLVDAFAPGLDSAMLLGTDSAGLPRGIDLIRARPQRFVTLGQGWVPAVLVARAVRHGLCVVVVTDRPAPWQAVAREAVARRAGAQVAGATNVGDTSLFNVVAPGTQTLPGDGAAGARLVVVVGALPVPGVRRTWQTTVHVLPGPDADPGLVAGADLVLAAAGAVSEGTRLPGLDLAATTRVAGLDGFEVAVIEGGRLTVLEVDPDR